LNQVPMECVGMPRAINDPSLCLLQTPPCHLPQYTHHQSIKGTKSPPRLSLSLATVTCSIIHETMPLIPRIRLDLAIGLVVAGTIWYISTRPHNPPHSIQDEEEEAEVDALTSLASETKTVIAGSLEALKPLLMDPTLLERIVLASDPRTMIRIAQVSFCVPGTVNKTADDQVSKYHNEFITCSPSIQLLLRNYYHQLPPISYPSASQRNYLTRTPKKRQLDDLLDREERLSRFKHTKFQRCAMTYIDVLCSGDYTIVTRCLSGKYREEGNLESGQVEDGYTVMVPRDPSDTVDEEEEDEEGDRPKRKQLLEGYAQRTVDVGEEIGDIAVRADEDLIIIATIVYDTLPRPSRIY
jgi:hypothetical protein